MKRHNTMLSTAFLIQALPVKIIGVQWAGGHPTLCLFVRGFIEELVYSAVAFSPQ